METLIRQKLIRDGQLCAHLARGEQSIFYHKAQADDNAAAYPQIILSAEKYSDPIKGVAGILTVDILTAQTNESSPEDIERLVRADLENVFFRGEEIFSVKWQRSEMFTEQAAERLPLIVGMTITFEIFEFPAAQTSNPDLIDALNAWAGQFQELFVIGLNEFDLFFEPTREKPAIYFDLEKIEFSKQILNALAWVQATANLHLFCPDIKARREWLQFLHNVLIVESVIMLGDRSPARLQKSSWNWQASETQGQIQLKYEYGLARLERYAHPLIKRNDSFDGALRWQN